MRHISAFRIVPVALAMFSPLYAEDESIYDDSSTVVRPNDLRIGYWLLPLKTSIDTQTNAAPGYHKDGYFQSGRRFSLQWVLPVSELSDEGGGLLALELSSTSYHQDQTLADPEISLKAYALTLHPDLAWTLTKHLQLEVGPFLGYGASTVSSGSGQGTFWEYGGRVACYWTITRHLQLGVDLRYLGTYARQNFTYGASSEDLVITTKGASAGLQFGYRF